MLGPTRQELGAEMDMRNDVQAIRSDTLRDWPEDAADADNGQYQCRCVECEQPFVGHKRRTHCKLCHRMTRLDTSFPAAGC